MGLSSLPGMLLGALSGQNQGGQGAQPPGGPGGPGGAPTPDPAMAFAQQSSQLQQANPQQLGDQADKIKQLLGAMFIQSATTLPNVSDKISKAMTAMSAVIKECQQAGNVATAVNQQQSPDVGFSLAQNGPPKQQPTGAPV